jgi:hypothetical protein
MCCGPLGFSMKRANETVNSIISDERRAKLPLEQESCSLQLASRDQLRNATWELQALTWLHSWNGESDFGAIYRGKRLL